MFFIRSVDKLDWESDTLIAIDEALRLVREDVTNLLAVEPVPLGEAKPPDGLGGYMFLVNGAVMYVGQAKGTKSLRDRLLRKYLSGDEPRDPASALARISGPYGATVVRSAPTLFLMRCHLARSLNLEYISRYSGGD